MKRQALTLAAASLVIGLFSVSSSADPPVVEKQPDTKLVLRKPIAGMVQLPLCSIDGVVTLDPNDHENGAIHYKGTATMTSKEALKGVNLWFDGPKYDCTCVDCPRLSSNALGFRPGSEWAADQKKSYKIDCPVDKKVEGEQGDGTIERFVASKSDPKAGNWEFARCTGTIKFKEK